MGKSSVKVSYQRVQRKRAPRGHRKAAEPIRPDTRPTSPLGRYLAENADSGLHVHELIEQFQEYDCEHRWVEEPVAITLFREVYQCTECAVLKERKRATK